MRRTAPRPRILITALALCAALVLGAIASAGAASSAGPVAAAAKKKCGKKKGKKGAEAAKKKCGKKGKKPTGATGPELPIGDWGCQYGSFQTQAGNRYTVNNGDQGTYKYNPSLGHVDFIGGSYDSFYGIYYPDPKVIELYSAINDPPVEIGDYGWSCSKS